MAADAMFTPNMLLSLENNEDLATIKNATNAIRSEFVACYKEATKGEEDVSEDYKKILHMTNLSLKMYATSHYKTTTYLEPSDIEQIKSSLHNYQNNSAKINEFKNTLIEDLNQFQKKIKDSHVQKMVDLTKQKQFLEKQIKVWDFKKNKLIAERLSKILWPYDTKTKEYEAKIAAAQIQVQQLAQKVQTLKQSRPAANEKDILLYQMQLKEKYAI